MKLWQYITYPFVYLWNYFRAGWEGKDGKFSYRRAFQYAYGVACIVIGLRRGLTQIEQYMSYFFGGMFLIMAGLIHGEQIFYFIKGHSADTKDQNDQTPTNDEITPHG